MAINFTKNSQEKITNNYKLIPEKINRFLMLLASNGNITLSAKMISMNRWTIYEFAKRCPEFCEAMADARAEARDLLLAEAWRRAIQGVEEPIFYSGKRCGSMTKYSDQLLSMLIRGYYGVPHYKDSDLGLSADAELESVIKDTVDKNQNELDYSKLSVEELIQLKHLIEKCETVTASPPLV